MSRYTEKFYAHNAERSRASAEQVVPIVMELMQPHPPDKVVDFGCGLGTWLTVFKEYNVARILGIDGNWVSRDRLLIPPDSFREADLSCPPRLDDLFELAVSLEVAEHIPPESAGAFIDVLTSYSPIILFSAAVPYQGGVSHVNEQWPAYWISRFKSRGYIPIDCLRRRIWENKNVQWFYAQNIMFFVRQDRLADYPLLEKEYRRHPLPLALIHPVNYLEQARKTILRNRVKRWAESLIRIMGAEERLRRYLDRSGERSRAWRRYFSKGHNFTGK